MCGLECFSSDLVCIGDGRDLLSEARLLADSSAKELKAVIGVALFKRGIILRPSFAHSCSVLQSPVRLKIKGKYFFFNYAKFRQMDFTIFTKFQYSVISKFRESEIFSYLDWKKGFFF